MNLQERLGRYLKCGLPSACYKRLSLELGRFERFQGRKLTTHMPMLGDYRRLNPGAGYSFNQSLSRHTTLRRASSVHAALLSRLDFEM